MQKDTLGQSGSGRRAVHQRALWLFGLLLCTAALGSDAPGVGQPAPALVVPELDGHVFDLKALRGRVVIVNFWATWCAPCRAEMPRLDAFYRRYHAQGFELLGMSVDDKTDAPAVQKIMKSFSYPAALAADAKINGFGAPVAVPLTWIIDARGTIRVRLLAGNAVTEAALEQQVVPLLQQAQAGPHS
jgi:cytochrome c biogenesis protein CcmG, thiol:disulfide interchange protein DsbE